MADEIKSERRTLYTGLIEEYFSSKTFIMSAVRVALPDSEGGGFREHPEWTERVYQVSLLNRSWEPISAIFNFLDDKKEDGEIFYYHLFPSRLVSPEGSESQALITMEQDINSWLEGKVFTTPEILLNSGKENGEINSLLSNRPYKFVSVRADDASMFSEISFLDGREPKSPPFRFFNLLESLEMPAEEIARRMKKKQEQ